jgi:hypothetical protein
MLAQLESIHLTKVTMVCVHYYLQQQYVLGHPHDTDALCAQVNKSKRRKLVLFLLPKHNPYVSEAESQNSDVK